MPARLLGIGLPLTVVAGAAAAWALFPGLTLIEAVVVGILLAPTDAALGQAVVTLPELPSRIRQGLNVESGLNDGICVPLLLIALAGGRDAGRPHDAVACGHRRRSSRSATGSSAACSPGSSGRPSSSSRVAAS